MNRELYAAMVREEPTAKRILEALDPQLEQLEVRSYPAGHLTAVSLIDAALGLLDDLDEVEKYLGPTGPAARAQNLHQWIWQAAATFWDAGQQAVAVEQAAKALTAHIQQKAGSSLVDRELVADVFSPKEATGRTRLWFPGDRSNDNWKSRQDGLHLMAQGAFAGIRNVVAHRWDPGWSQQEALEYLAVLSTVARWTDATEVHRL
jgi:uncharacterized protein (TIGR02391 family)